VLEALHLAFSLRIRALVTAVKINTTADSDMHFSSVVASDNSIVVILVDQTYGTFINTEINQA
jgi:predicted lactoylglutathione lyase